MAECAKKICSLRKRHSIIEVLQYFENNRELIARNKNVIKTIGVYYHRIYDGGIERAISNLMPVWIDMGYKVVLFTEESPNPKDYYYPEEVHRIVIPMDDNIEGRLCAIEDGIIDKHIDVFIHNGWESEVLLWEMLTVKSLGIPFIVYSHGHFSNIYTLASDYSMVSGRVFALCDKIIALSDVNAKFYELCGCEVVRLENPIPDEIREVQSAHSDINNHHVLWIGRIAQGKRLDDALRVIAEVKKKVADVELDIVGTGNDIDIKNARLLCGELGVSDLVHFHGYHKNVGKYYQNSAVVMMTSEKEGYSYVLLESKAYGKPCVMYSLPYLSLVNDGMGIKTAQIGDINKMSENLCEVLLDHDIRYQMEQEAKESFNNVSRYNYRENWTKIFKSMEISDKDRSKSMDCGQNYSLINSLFDTLYAGVNFRVNYVLDTSFDRRVGTKLLRFPRAVKRILWPKKEKNN